MKSSKFQPIIAHGHCVRRLTVTEQPGMHDQRLDLPAWATPDAGIGRMRTVWPTLTCARRRHIGFYQTDAMYDEVGWQYVSHCCCERPKVCSCYALSTTIPLVSTETGDIKHPFAVTPTHQIYIKDCLLLRRGLVIRAGSKLLQLAVTRKKSQRGGVWYGFIRSVTAAADANGFIVRPLNQRVDHFVLLHPRPFGLDGYIGSNEKDAIQTTIIPPFGCAKIWNFQWDALLCKLVCWWYRQACESFPLHPRTCGIVQLLERKPANDCMGM
jgi:hypothetical protein